MAADREPRPVGEFPAGNTLVPNVEAIMAMDASVAMPGVGADIEALKRMFPSYKWY